MGRLVIALALTVYGFISAETIRYEVRSPLFGKLGDVRLDYRLAKGRYEATLEAATRGIAKTLTRHRRDRYRSVGTITSRGLRSSRYEAQMEKKGKREITDYRFEPPRRIVKHKIRHKHGKLDKDTRETLPYYSSRDVLALYLDLFCRGRPPRPGSYYAVGIKRRYGPIRIATTPPKKARSIRRKLDAPKEAPVMTLVIPGKKGSHTLYTILDSRGFVTRAYTVAIPVVGTLILRRIGK
ncbi:DUF3108 domain-containing protein [Nitratifractor sp.]